MEPLEKAFVVVEEVVGKICRSLGPEAQNHINRDRLFTKAERQIKNGLSVEVASKTIVSALIPDIQATLKERVKDHQHHDVQENDFPEVKEENIEPSVFPPELRASTSRSPVYSDGQNGSSARESSQSSSTTLDSPQSAESQSSSTAMTLNDLSEISVLTPDPPKPAPVIEILDDSLSSRPSSRNSDILIVEEVEKPNKPSARTEGKTSDDKKKNEDISKILSMLHDLEKTLGLAKAKESEQEIEEGPENGKDTKQSRNFNKMSSDDESDSKDSKVMADELQNSSSSSENKSDAIGNKSTKKKSTLINGINSFDIEKELAEAKADSYTDENRNKKTNINGLTSMLNENSLNHNHPSQELWLDAHFVCSLLPYFQLNDVYQSMFDNYYHPDRRAYVLGLYIELAVDQGEMVPDRVFHGLRAAKKRPHGDTVGSGSNAGVKRFKVEEGGAKCVSEIKQWQSVGETKQLLSDSVPSTSGAVVRKVAADSTFKDEYVKLFEPDVETPYAASRLNENKQENDYWTSEQKEVQDERQKWCKEKANFIAEVIPGVEKDSLRVQIQMCHSDADVERLIVRLMEEGPPPDPPDTPQGYPPSLVSPDRPETSAFQPVERASTSAFQPFEQGSSNDSSPGASSSESQTAGEGSDEANGVEIEEKIMSHVATLCEMFSDADPDYLQER
ncbi:uncharacterized protein LOC125030537 [Penaeus chinensis]|uniref:uncharacterized protein LOC125030537 n=1 Tax=Penaeus chinensis TaxID=139456 RepID=UPI001FB570CA|nr:uncharacterized protein LOC125030537 [Penaeus chinensis]